VSPVVEPKSKVIDVFIGLGNSPELQPLKLIYADISVINVAGFELGCVPFVNPKKDDP
jgi:hypothetical protein